MNPGFTREACIRDGCEVDGRFYDRIKMGILRTDWSARHPPSQGTGSV